MSRLKREGNPPSNQLASPVPQAWDPSINDFREITGQNLGGGRFGADGVQWGKTASGLFVPVRVTNDGVQEVQLSGTIEIIDVTFDGVLFPRVDDVETIESDTIDVSHLKNIQIFMINSVKTDEPSSISVLISLESSPRYCIFYDWNREDWVTSGLFDGGSYSIPFTTVKVPYTALPGSLFNLTTHPDLYWVKEYKGKVLQVRFQTNSLPESGRTNAIRVWVVGERL